LTLRLRLLVLLVVIVAAGLLISDVVTYTSLRAFLTQQVDKQLLGSTFPVERALRAATASSSAPSTGGAAGVLPADHPAGGTQSPSYHPGAGSPQSSIRDVLIPPGTYGELRSAAGKVIAHVFFDYGGTAPPAPRIPAALPGSGSASGGVFFFSARPLEGGGGGYRVVARSLPHGRGTIVVAQPLTNLQGTLRRLLLIEVVVSALLLAVLGGVSWLMVRRDLRPLEEMATTAGAIASGDLSLRVSSMTPGTEVGELGVAFNTMIGEIEDAFAAREASEERLRRFLADASQPEAAPVALRDAWLARLCSGELRSGVAVAALRRPGPPAMTARPDAAGGRWRFDGLAPWVTGWGLVDVVVVAARHGDDLVWALIDATSAPSLQAVPLALAAQQASATVSLHLSDHLVGADRVLAVEPYEQWRARDVKSLRQNGYFPVGVAGRAARLLESPTLAEEAEALATALEERPDAEMPTVRAEASLLAVRATTTLVVERGGRAVGFDDHAQRLARDAMFLLVFGQTPSIRAEQVRQLQAG